MLTKKDYNRLSNIFTHQPDSEAKDEMLQLLIGWLRDCNPRRFDEAMFREACRPIPLIPGGIECGTPPPWYGSDSVTHILDFNDPMENDTGGPVTNEYPEEE